MLAELIEPRPGVLFGQDTRLARFSRTSASWWTRRSAPSSLQRGVIADQRASLGTPEATDGSVFVVQLQPRRFYHFGLIPSESASPTLPTPRAEVRPCVLGEPANTAPGSSMPFGMSRSDDRQTVTERSLGMPSRYCARPAGRLLQNIWFSAKSFCLRQGQKRSSGCLRKRGFWRPKASTGERTKEQLRDHCQCFECPETSDFRPGCPAHTGVSQIKQLRARD